MSTRHWRHWHMNNFARHFGIFPQIHYSSCASNNLIITVPKSTSHSWHVTDVPSFSPDALRNYLLPCGSRAAKNWSNACPSSRHPRLQRKHHVTLLSEWSHQQSSNPWKLCPRLNLHCTAKELGCTRTSTVRRLRAFKPELRSSLERRTNSGVDRESTGTERYCFVSSC